MTKTSVEQAKRLNIPVKDIKLLFGLANLTCSFPGCGKLIYDAEGTPQGEICHIEAAMPGGQRFNPDMSNRERSSYDNLILLCFDHHKVTDNEIKYSVSDLKLMKKSHEESLALNGKLLRRFRESGEDLKAPDIERAIELFKRNESFQKRSRKDFKIPVNYIKRKIFAINDSNPLWSRQFYDLVQEVKIKRNITLLGVAGSGKSIELQYLAYYFSTFEPDYYTLKIELNSICSNQSVNDIIKIQFPDFEYFNGQQFLLILDGLDEVPQIMIGDVSKQISNLGKQFRSSIIVVSCRNNFYTIETETSGARISGFATYGLDFLSERDISLYCKEVLKGKSQVFLEKVSNSQFYGLVKSPFYLVHLVEYHCIYNQLPQSRPEIFEYLIENRVVRDIVDKYKNIDIELEDFQEIIKIEIEKLAVAVECLGKNYLADKEYRVLIKDPQLLKLLRYTFLFDKNVQGNWQFEHNNFKEYLAARYLSKLNAENIKRFISFEPEFQKIKPNWVNTLSFLLSILKDLDHIKFDLLLSWILSIEPQLLVRFERDKLELAKREEIFFTIYKDFERKGILLYSDNFHEDDLSFFVADSDKVAETLLSKVDTLNEPWKKSEALRLISKLEISTKYLKEIQEKVIHLLSDRNIPREHKLGYFYNLRDLNIYSEELTKTLLKIVDLNSSKYFRAGFYAYLFNANKIDDYVELVIAGIGKLEIPQVFINSASEKEREPSLSSEKFNLERLISKFDSNKVTLRLLEWAQNLDEYGLYDAHKSILKNVLLNATNLYKRHHHEFLYDAVLKLLLNSARKFITELSSEFNHFFSSTGTSIKAFNSIRKAYPDAYSTHLDYYYVISSVSNQDCADIVLNEYRKNIITDQTAKIFLQIFSYHSSELRGYFLNKLNEIADNKFTLKTKKDFDEEFLLRLGQDCRLLLDKESLRNKIQFIFKESGRDSFNKKELWDYKSKYLSDDFYSNNIVLDTLRSIASEHGKVSIESVEKHFNDPLNWFWYQTHQLINIDSRNEGFEIFDDLENHWKEWLNEALIKSNFQKAVFLDEHNTIQCSYLEHFVIFIADRIGVELPDHIYLAFLYLDSSVIPEKQRRDFITDTITMNPEDLKIPKNLNKYVISKVGYEKVLSRIISNINSNLLCSFNQKMNHASFCYEYNIVEGIELIKELISDKESESHYKKIDLFRWYVKLTEDIKLIENLLPTLEEYVQLKAIELLLESSSEVALDFILNLIHNNENNTEYYFRLLEVLSKSYIKLSFEYTKKWIMFHKRMPDRYFLTIVMNGSNINDLQILFEDCLKHNYGNSLHNNKDVFLSRIIDLAAKNDLDYKNVRKLLQEWIDNFNVKALYSQIQKLDLEYYAKKSSSVSIQQVKKMLDTYTIR